MWTVFWGLIGLAIVCTAFIGVFALGVAVYQEFKDNNIKF